MTIAVTVSVKGVRGAVAGISKWTRVGEITSTGLMRWGRVLERDVKASAIQAGIKKFTGTLRNKGIRWDQKPKGKTGRLFIRQYGVYLDSMNTHWVSITRGRTRLLAWALRARNSAIRDAAARVVAGKSKSASIKVHKHPYIKRGFTRARPKLNPILRQELAKLRRSKR